MQTQELGQSGRLNAMTAYLDHVIASSQKDDGPIATPPAKIACAIAAPLGAVGLEALLACGFGLCVAQCHRQAFDNQLSFRAIGCRPIGRARLNSSHSCASRMP